MTADVRNAISRHAVRSTLVTILLHRQPDGLDSAPSKSDIDVGQPF
jgi:hypothetical protein